MKEKPLLSVCVTTYQHVHFIQQCLDSILAQETTFPFEVIIGEDASTDGTRELCQSYAKKYPEKIRLILRSRKDVIYINGKPTGRYNLIETIKATKGKYIAICEGDDYWTAPYKLQKQVDFLESNPDYNICFHNAYLLFENKKNKPLEPFKGDHFFKDTYLEKEIVGKWFMPTASLVFRKPNAIQFPEWFTTVAGGDVAMTSIFCNGGKVKYINEKMSVYRKHDGGITNYLLGIKLLKDRIYLLALLNNHFNNKYEKEINEEIKDFIVTYFIYEIKNNFFSSAMLFFKKVIAITRLKLSSIFSF